MKFSYKAVLYETAQGEIGPDGNPVAPREIDTLTGEFHSQYSWSQFRWHREEAMLHDVMMDRAVRFGAPFPECQLEIAIVISPE